MNSNQFGILSIYVDVVFSHLAILVADGDPVFFNFIGTSKCASLHRRCSYVRIHTKTWCCGWWPSCAEPVWSGPQPWASQPVVWCCHDLQQHHHPQEHCEKHHHHLHCHHHHDHIVSGAHLVAAQVVHLTLHHRLPPNVHLSVDPRFNNSLRSGHIFNSTTIIPLWKPPKITHSDVLDGSTKHWLAAAPWANHTLLISFFGSKSHFDREKMFFVFYSNLHSGLYPWKPEERKRLRILI